MAGFAVLVLSAHLVWLLLVVFGAIWTRGRPAWSAVHILALLWGIVTEAGPWPCPLTLAGQYFEARAGAESAIFWHQNLPPFVCKQLIQHLVKSNPSPGYISRVAQVFINDGNNMRYAGSA